MDCLRGVRGVFVFGVGAFRLSLQPRQQEDGIQVQVGPYYGNNNMCWGSEPHVQGIMMPQGCCMLCCRRCKIAVAAARAECVCDYGGCGSMGYRRQFVLCVLTSLAASQPASQAAREPGSQAAKANQAASQPTS